MPLETAQKIISVLKQAGFASFLVGGCVRDRLLSKVPKDFDILTTASIENINAIFEKVIPVGIKHGTVTVVQSNTNFEVTSLAGSGEDHVLLLRENCLHRDFTINSMILDPDSDTVLDFHGGKADLENRVIRAVTDPAARISEDRLRMLRAVRFSATLGFTIEQTLFEAIRQNSRLIKTVSSERVRDELLKLLSAEPDRLSMGLEILRTTGLLAEILPEVQSLVGFDQSGVHHKKDTYTHTIDVLINISHLTASPVLRFSALLHDIGKFTTRSGEPGDYHFYDHQLSGAEMATSICDRLKFSGKDTDMIVTLIRNHLKFKHLSLSPTPRAMAKYVRRNSKFLNELLLLSRADIELENMDWLFQQIQDFRPGLTESLPAPLLDGFEIMELLKIPAGTLVRKIKDFLLEEQIMGTIVTREDACMVILEKFGGTRQEKLAEELK